MLLIWWFLATVSPGIVLSNNARSLEETPRMPLQKGTKTDARSVGALHAQGPEG